ncbi:MAG: DUF452 family protein [Muribaculaceae bacterium]|nr:DUF452 family protein [Muribaculaceae bacterium]
MKIDFISRNNNRRLLLLMAGWSTDADFYTAVDCPGWDVVVVSDYSDLSARELGEIQERYETVYLIAWSLGVAVAEYLASTGELNSERVTAAYSVNGTPCPVSDAYGIPDNIYDGTERNLTHATLRRFLNRMSSSSDKYRYTSPKPVTQYDIESLRLQLRNLRNLHFGHPLLPWMRAYISENDLIFRPDNQRRYWSEKSIQTVDIPSGHYIPLDVIARMVTPDISRIGQRFEQAVDYDAHAEAQHAIAHHLLSLLPADTDNPDHILELGTGTGYFTRLIASAIHPAEMTMVDLYMTPRFGIAPAENHIAMDAELFMGEVADTHKYDMIVSASTIQWFADIRLFFKRAASALTHKGMLLCSSFLPGNYMNWSR